MIKRAVLLLFVFFLGSVIYSCDPVCLKIKDIEFKALGSTDAAGQTTVYNSLTFEIKSKFKDDDFGYLSQNYAPQLMARCYATSKSHVLDDSLLAETFALHFDKPFVFRNETILAQTNVFEIEDIRKLITIYEYNDNPDDYYSITVIDFDYSFTEETVFEGSYTAIFSCGTSSGLFFEKATSFRSQ